MNPVLTAKAQNPALQAQALMADARALWQAGELGSAITAMSEACEISLSTSNEALKAEAHMRAGIVYNYANRFDLAFRAIDAAETFAKSAQVPQLLRLKIQTNRASFLLAAGFLQKSLASHASIVSQVSDEPVDDELNVKSAALGNLIYNNLLLGKLKAALDAGAEIEKNIRNPGSPIDLATRVNNYCWYATALSQAGNTKTAITLLSEARELVPAGNRALEITFSIALGVAEVHAGLTDTGITRLVETAQLAEHLQLFHQHALQALTLVYEHVGDIAKALETVERLEVVMKEAARGVVGIEGDDDAHTTSVERELKAKAIAESEADAIAAKKSGREIPDHIKPKDADADTAWIRRLDDRAAKLRMKRFNELTHSERGEVFDGLAKAAALVDDDTGKHCARVEKLTYDFAKALGWDEARAQLLARAARLHDVGKLGIPHRILLAPRKLTPMEYEIVKKHVNIGVDLLGFSQNDVVKLALIIAQHHHEKWDGSGYPKRLFEEAVPIEARIVSICDVFDVITHQRSYKRAWNVQFAREELEFHAGKQFDPNLIEIFLRDVVKEDYVIPTYFPNETPSLFETTRF
jgi:HD-GYP domain-containing protein (c-di-GMP phosphodiesterase class II)